MPADKMTKPKKPPEYELHRRSKNYVGLYLGEHCLAAICTKKPCGMLDALFLLKACTEYEKPASEKGNIL